MWWSLVISGLQSLIQLFPQCFLVGSALTKRSVLQYRTTEADCRSLEDWPKLFPATFFFGAVVHVTGAACRHQFWLWRSGGAKWLDDSTAKSPHPRRQSSWLRLPVGARVSAKVRTSNFSISHGWLL
jgi:hypothetical protein